MKTLNCPNNKPDDPTQPEVQPQASKNPPAQAQNLDDDNKNDNVDATYDFIMQPRATSNPTLEDQPTSDHNDQDSEDMEDDVPLVCKVFFRKCKRENERQSNKKNDSNS
ncbi:hypothetical protein ACH5RR_021330 [Cinchona calisaya]|uniref:Uncharacterized protein n=1 Tax=Cinchona calisaya TaxID=153742 RepID=A0ABD2ZIS3_9GENT